MRLPEDVGEVLERSEARRESSVVNQKPPRNARFSDELSLGAVKALSNLSYTFPSCPIVP